MAKHRGVFGIALGFGLQQAFARPLLLLTLWLANLLVAVPAGLLVYKALEDAIGPSLASERLLQGFDMEWFGEFSDEADGLVASFRPTVAKGGAFADNLEGWATGKMFRKHREALAVACIWALLWLFLLGGVVARMAQPGQRFGPDRFVETAARYALRFGRLFLIALPLYVAVYLLFSYMYKRIAELTRDVTAERTVLVYCLGAVTLTIVLLLLIRLCFDYAKAATVIEDRRSMFLAALRGAAFVARHPLRTAGLPLVIGLIGLLLLAFYMAAGPGVGQADARSIAIAFAIGQLFLLVRLGLRLSLLGAEVELYRRLTKSKQDAAIPI